MHTIVTCNSRVVANSINELKNKKQHDWNSEKNDLCSSMQSQTVSFLRNIFVYLQHSMLVDTSTHCVRTQSHATDTSADI